MEIAIAGEGEVVIRYIDQSGRTLMQEKISVAGSPTVEARRIIALSVETAGGRASLAPVLVQRTNPRQRVRFDGEEPARFTRKRCEEIGCPAEVADEAERGCAGLIGPGEAAVFLSEDEALTRIVSAVAHRKGDPHT